MYNIKILVIAAIVAILAGFGVGRVSAPKPQEIDMTQYVTKAEYDQLLEQNRELMRYIRTGGVSRAEAERRLKQMKGKRPEVISNPERLKLPSIKK